ncbi:MAG TPA: acyl carrier protein [Candidatus Binatia bacterium]
MPALEQEIRQFIIDNFLFGEDDGKLSNDDSFLDKGIIDSTGVLELVALVEGKYGFKVKEPELVPDNLDTINKLAQFISRKFERGSSAGECEYKIES